MISSRRELKEKEALRRALAREVAVAASRSATVEFAIEESVSEHARGARATSAGRRLRPRGDSPRRHGADRAANPGGTDGSRLSFMGLPTPNLFAGEHNFHSRLEWVSAQDMDKAVEVIVRVAGLWAAALRIAVIAAILAFHCKVKFTVTVIITGTGAPFSSVGVNSHCRTASMPLDRGAESSGGLSRRDAAVRIDSGFDNHDTINPPAWASSGKTGRTSLIFVGVLMFPPNRSGAVPSAGRRGRRRGGGGGWPEHDARLPLSMAPRALVQFDRLGSEGVGFRDQLLLQGCVTSRFARIRSSRFL